MTSESPPDTNSRPTSQRAQLLLYTLAYAAVTILGIVIGLGTALWFFSALTLLLGSVGSAFAGIGIGAVLLSRVVYEIRCD